MAVKKPDPPKAVKYVIVSLIALAVFLAVFSIPPEIIVEPIKAFFDLLE